MRKRMNKFVCKGDKVVVISGNDKGKVGEVLNRTEDRVIVQGVNMCKKHVKPTQDRPKGDIISMERPIHISNVKICNNDGMPLNLYCHIEGKQKNICYNNNGKEEVYKKI